MRLKSYLRGIGIGVLVTAAVFIISGSSDKRSTMTDEQIIARAKELGMVESTMTLAEPTRLVANNDEQPTKGADKAEEVVPTAEAKQEDGTAPTKDVEPTKEPQPTQKVEPTKEPQPTQKVEPTKELQPTKEAEPTKKVEPAKEEKPAVTKAVEDDGEYVIIVVNSGDGSDTVSRKLYEAGIVEDAGDYDRYLMANGYDRTITTGNHKLSASMTREEIAKNLTSRTK